MGRIYTFTGASGVGKSTIVKELLEIRDSFDLVVSITTREPRDSDLPGEYRYISDEKFDRLEESGEFLWATSAHGNRYGTLKSSIDKAVEQGGCSFMILTPDVLEILHGYTHRVASFFILSPPESVLRERLRERGESREEIERRLEDCKEWDRQAKEEDFYYFVRNDGPVEKAVGQVLNVIDQRGAK